MAISHSVLDVKLKNGTQGLVINIPGSHTVYMTFQFRAGAQYVPPELCQVPHIIEHMAFTHPGKYLSQEEFSRVFTRRSASEDASTDEVHVTYEASCSLSDYMRILEMMRLVIVEPTFTQENFDIELSTIHEELTADLNNDARFYWQKANRLSGGGGRKDQEKIDSLTQTSVEDVRKFYKSSHVSDNLRFVIAGDVDSKQISTALEAWKLPRGARPTLRQDTFRTLREPVLLNRPQYGALDFSLSLLAPGLMSPEEDVTWAYVNHLLFQTYHSRVFGELRSRGVCYDVGATQMNVMHNYREIEIYGSASSEHIEETVQRIVDQLIAVASGEITESELAEVREYILGYKERRLETPGEVASYYEGQYLLDGTYIPDEEAQRLAESVTLQQIASYAKAWITERQRRFGLIGNINETQAKRLQDIVDSLTEGVH